MKRNSTQTTVRSNIQSKSSTIKVCIKEEPAEDKVDLQKPSFCKARFKLEGNIEDFDSAEFDLKEDKA